MAISLAYLSADDLGNLSADDLGTLPVYVLMAILFLSVERMEVIPLVMAGLAMIQPEMVASDAGSARPIITPADVGALNILAAADATNEGPSINADEVPVIPVMTGIDATVTPNEN